MFGAIAAINPVAALSSAISVGESALAYKGQREANSTNQAIAREQMRFQKEMSNTAFQRSMTDMKKGGLNPILAYKMGGASTPLGASIPVQNEFGGMSGSMMNNLNTASTIMTERQKRENMQSTLESDKAYRDLNAEQQEAVKAQVQKIDAEISNIEAQTNERITENEIREIIAKSFSENNALALFDRLGVSPSAIGIIGTYFGLKNAKERGFGIGFPDTSTKDEYTPGGNRRSQRKNY